MIAAPITQEIMAAGPATLAAVPEPNSQPEPIRDDSASITPEKRLILFFGMITPFK